jgi:hypothetical protein
MLSTTNSASPDPRTRTSPWPQPNGLRLRGSDSTSTTEDGLDLDLGGASTSPNLGREPATSTGGAIITLLQDDSGYGEQDRRPIRLASPDRQ